MKIQPVDVEGAWFNDSQQYAANAVELRDELVAVVAELNSKWPGPLDLSVRGEEITPELWALTKRRDRLSDAVRIFSAMAVEAFLNLFGIVRMEEPIYQEHFERLGLIPKLRQLLLICDSIDLPRNHPIVLILDRIAQRRNSLVHPKAKSAAGLSERPSVPMPGEAQAAVRDMEEFFSLFAELVPRGKHLLPIGARR